MTRPPSTAKAPPPPPLVHRVPVATLDREAENAVRLTPDAEARDRIARFLDIEAVERLTLTVRLAPKGEGWEARGQLTATVVQSCVVTLEPVRDVIDVPVRRTYLPAPELPQAADTELDEDDLDPPDPLGEQIDLGQLAVETLALALDPWPRAEGAALDPGLSGRAEAARLDEEADRPFAGLAELRARLGRERE